PPGPSPCGSTESASGGVFDLARVAIIKCSKCFLGREARRPRRRVSFTDSRHPETQPPPTGTGVTPSSQSMAFQLLRVAPDAHQERENRAAVRVAGLEPARARPRGF